MQTLRHRFHVTFGLILALAGFTTGAQGALVGASGYTNDFSSQPPAADWSTVSIAGTATDIATTAQLDAAVQAIAASSITAQLTADAANF